MNQNVNSFLPTLYSSHYSTFLQNINSDMDELEIFCKVHNLKLGNFFCKLAYWNLYQPFAPTLKVPVADFEKNETAHVFEKENMKFHKRAVELSEKIVLQIITFIEHNRKDLTLKEVAHLSSICELHKAFVAIRLTPQLVLAQIPGATTMVGQA